MTDSNLGSDGEFKPFPKIARLSRDIVITEKIDGTNAQVVVSEDGKSLRAGSRTRWVTVGDDNYGFAAWVMKNYDSLLGLGAGAHFGEWWGSGIQRGYGLLGGEKRFSLFNTARWGDSGVAAAGVIRPACCGVVPVLYKGPFETSMVEDCLWELQTSGSRAAPGFMRPEGVVIWHDAARQLFKKTIEKDSEWKGK